jgi:hypothetical protein
MMDGQRFDELTRTLANAVSRRSVIRGTVGVAVGAALSRLGGARVEAADKITICHMPGRRAEKTMEVPQSAVAGHLGHGDRLGACECPPSQVCGNSSDVCCPEGEVCDPEDQTCGVSCSTGACSSNADCCSNICTCGANEAGHCQTPFSQGFETDASGWTGATRVASGTNGVPSNGGAFHAQAAPGGFAAFTRWGGYTNVFPGGGYSTSVDIYLDLAAGVSNDTRFDWSSAVNQTDCNHRRDFVFNAGYYQDSDATGTGPRFVISASNNAGRGNSNPKNPGRDPLTVAVTGWYTFEHHFMNAGGVLEVELIVNGPGGMNSWTLTDPSDVIGTTVGGNRYGGFPTQEFPVLPIDNSARA